MKDNLLFTGEEPFQITKRNFALGAAQSAYTLYFSVDYNGMGDPEDATWHQYSDQIPAGFPLIVEGHAAGLWWKCVGNTGDIYVRC